MKKNLFLILIALTSFFIFGKDVNAALNYKTMEIECIYGSGVAASLVYDETSGNLSSKISEYPVSKTSEIINASGNISIFDCEGNCPNTVHNVTDLKKMVCPNKIYVWRIQTSSRESADFEWKHEIKEVYSLRTTTDYGRKNITDYYNKRVVKDGWWVSDANAEQKAKVLPIKASNFIGTGKDNGDGYNWVSIPLVAERLYIVGELDQGKEGKDGDYGDYSSAYKSAATQAVGSSGYIQFLKKSNGTYYVKKGNTITSVPNNTSLIKKGTKKICFKESFEESDPNRSDSLKKFNYARHEIQKANSDGSCGDGYILYEILDEPCKITPENNAKSFCDEYGNTAAVLIQIINILQILVPALVIIYTCIDIGKMVIAGNLDEELPKQKKSIIVRLIVMIFFFFLPLVIRMIANILNESNGKEIYDISCLFNNGVQERNQTEDDCINP